MMNQTNAQQCRRLCSGSSQFCQEKENTWVLVLMMEYSLTCDDKDLIEEDSLEFDDGFGNIIVVDNLPIMTKEKFEKLKGVVQQINSQIEVIKHNGLYMFVEEDTANNFIECKTTQLSLPKKRVWIQARQSTQFSSHV
ncbi:hypothetical protein R6Q59_027747 [Mikania micrantha]